MRPALAALVATLVVACAPGPPPAAGDAPVAPVPALRTDTSAEGDAELGAAAASLVGAPSVRLAADAFRRSPSITVESDPGRTLQGPRDGRRRGGPIHLHLERDAAGCRLRRGDDAAVVRLDAVRCAAVEASR